MRHDEINRAFLFLATLLLLTHLWLKEMQETPGRPRNARILDPATKSSSSNIRIPISQVKRGIACKTLITPSCRPVDSGPQMP